MSPITRISLLILFLGVVIGLFIGGASGGWVGLILSGAIAVIFLCIANIFKANRVPEMGDPFKDIPSQTQLDRSQLPRGAYERHGDGGI
jgi:hypothetical protein